MGPSALARTRLWPLMDAVVAIARMGGRDRPMISFALRRRLSPNAGSVTTKEFGRDRHRRSIPTGQPTSTTETFLANLARCLTRTEKVKSPRPTALAIGPS